MTSDPTETIFDQNLCVSCGVCNVRQSTSFEFDEHGYLLPINKEKLEVHLCPMISPVSEDVIAEEKFGDSDLDYSAIGYFDKIIAARIKDKAKLKARSSGGIITFVLESLLNSGKVDAVATVFSYNTEPYFRYKLCTDVEDLKYAATSAYYPVELSSVISEAHEKGLSIAVTGLPCSIKGLNNLIREHASYQKTIRYQIALICGHLKTSKYAEALSNQLPDVQLPQFNFRGHEPGSPAKVKFFQKFNDVDVASARTSTLYSGTFNYGFFQYEGCHYCDDVIGETSDLSVGDAWLPEYVDQLEGMSLCVSRNPDITKILSSESLEVATLTSEDVISAQQGGYRQRREGLAYRLSKYPKHGIKKRAHLLPKHISSHRKQIYEARYQLSTQSHKHFYNSGSLSEFEKKMSGLLVQLKKVSADNFIKRVIQKAVREIRKLALRVK